MPPTKCARAGLLGVEVPGSSDDSDYMPSSSEEGEGARPASKAQGNNTRQRRQNLTSPAPWPGAVAGIGSADPSTTGVPASQSQDGSSSEADVPLVQLRTRLHGGGSFDNPDSDTTLRVRQGRMIRQASLNQPKSGPLSSERSNKRRSRSGVQQAKRKEPERKKRRINETNRTRSDGRKTTRQSRAQTRAPVVDLWFPQVSGASEWEGVDYSALPTGVLAQVLSFACREGALPVAAVACCICHSWREAVRSTPELWSMLDMSHGWCNPHDLDIKRSASLGRWEMVRKLSVEGCNRLSDKSLDLVAAGCPSINALSLSSCTNFSVDGISKITTSLSSLTSINLSRIMTKPVRQAAIDSVIKGMSASPCAERIQSLTAEYCPHLTNKGLRAILSSKEGGGFFSLTSLALTASGTMMGRINLQVEELQLACPKLEVPTERLQLNGLGGMYGWLPGAAPARSTSQCRPGFPRLRMAELGACQTLTSTGNENGTSYVTDEVLARLLHSSSCLQELDISGCRAGSAGLMLIPEVAPLRRIVLERSAAASDEALNTLCLRFSSSLEEIIAANGGRHVTDEGLLAMVDCKKLVAVDISATAVSSDGVFKFLQALTAGHDAFGHSTSCIKSISLASCRGVSRELRAAALEGAPSMLQHLEALPGGPR